ncbi:hypothetical protein DFH94DRAFT_695511 [Russula ochroleuca]|uniref:10TM putative phosphate transporter extracellular tail domain-containing protein n=1 Tax=Russula ochroleuca TaxID=152965 RepID=A0A9P5MR69_9AGAM|nr:hypothetical protein DFH94DRAFT_695511 [Russula ochroleuca]
MSANHETDSAKTAAQGDTSIGTKVGEGVSGAMKLIHGIGESVRGLAIDIADFGKGSGKAIAADGKAEAKEGLRTQNAMGCDTATCHMSLGTTVRRVTSSTISFAILTALIKALPLTLADRSYDRVGPEVPTTADAPKPIPPISEDVEGINYTDVPPIDEPPASSPSLLAKLGYGHGPADFTHPVTVEKQRVIWLPKDPLGLVKEIEWDLDSREVLHSTEAAEMDAKGYVDDSGTRKCS